VVCPPLQGDSTIQAASVGQQRCKAFGQIWALQYIREQTRSSVLFKWLENPGAVSCGSKDSRGHPAPMALPAGDPGIMGAGRNRVCALSNSAARAPSRQYVFVRITCLDAGS
jgi:hypothetical protein